MVLVVLVVLLQIGAKDFTVYRGVSLLVPTSMKNVAKTSRDGDSPKLPASIRLEAQMRGGGGGIRRGRKRRKNIVGDEEEEIGLFGVKEEGRTGFSEGWQGCPCRLFYSDLHSISI